MIMQKNIISMQKVTRELGSNNFLTQITLIYTPMVCCMSITTKIIFGNSSVNFRLDIMYHLIYRKIEIVAQRIKHTIFNVGP